MKKDTTCLKVVKLWVVSIRENIKYSYSYVPKILEHKKIILRLEREKKGKNTLRIIRHDMDKVLIYTLFPYISTNIISNMHDKREHHKYTNMQKRAHIEEVILDWESTQYKTYQKGMNAYEYCHYAHQEVYPILKPILEEWGINGTKEEVAKRK